MGKQLELKGLFRSQTEEYTFTLSMLNNIKGIKFLISRIDRILAGLDPERKKFAILSKIVDKLISISDWLALLAYSASRDLKEYKHKTVADFRKHTERNYDLNINIEVRSVDEIYEMYLRILKDISLNVAVYDSVLERSHKAREILDETMNGMNTIGKSLEKLM